MPNHIEKHRDIKSSIGYVLNEDITQEVILNITSNWNLLIIEILKELDVNIQICNLLLKDI